MKKLSPAIRHIALVGFSGSGKSSCGKLVAKKMRMRFVDIDRLIVETYGITIAEIFVSKGEKYFRNIERKTIEAVMELISRSSVIAVGGGGFENRATRKLLLARTTIVYLKCSIVEILKRMAKETDRPLLNISVASRREIVRSLLAQRKKHYEMAHITVTTTGKTVTEVTSEICRKYKEYDVTHL
jgi:shikimate kinase